MFNSLNQLSIYRFVFFLEFAVAEFFFCKNLKRRKYFWLRLSLSLLASLLLTFFFPISKYDPFHISLLFFFIFVLHVAICKIAFKERLNTILFCTVAAYTIQHVSYAIYTLIVDNLYLGRIVDYLIETNPYYANNALAGTGYSVVTLIVYIWVYFTIYWVSARTLANKLKRGADIRIAHSSMILLSFVIVFVDIYFNLVTVFYNTNSKFALLEGVYNVLVCFLALLLQFSQLRVTEVVTELDSMKQLSAERDKQYEMAKKNIEIINIKCHDLKHQIHRIGKNERIEPDEMKQIEKAINIYDLTVKTGNEALDIILTEKALLCEKNHIELTIIADGASLSFLSARDIYSFFGNALDNAIEANEYVEESKRNISLYIKKKLNFISIHVENPYQKDVVTENDILKTSKEDDSLHGFGFLSMKEIVERYHGNINYQAKDHRFSLDVLFPEQ